MSEISIASDYQIKKKNSQITLHEKDRHIISRLTDVYKYKGDVHEPSTAAVKDITQDYTCREMNLR